MRLKSKPLKQILHGALNYPRLSLLAIFSVIMTAAIILSIGYGVRLLIDQGLTQKTSHYLNLSVFGLVGGALLLAITAYIRTRSTAQLAEHVVSDLRKALFEHVIRLRMESFEQMRVGDILARFGADMEQIRNFVSSSLAVTIRVLLQILGGAVLLFITSAKLAFVVLAFAPIIVLPIFFFGRKVKHYTLGVQKFEGSILSYVEERLNAFELVKAYEQELPSQAGFQEILTHKMSYISKRSHMRSALISMVIAFVFSAIAIMLWLGAREVLSGTLSAGELTSFIFYAIVVAGSVNNLAEILSELNGATGALENMNQIFDYAIEPERTALPKFTNTIGSLAFSKVSFSYPTRPDVMVLKDISFKVRAGERIAIVGPSGVGKSTTFNLLLGLYRPNVGDILINDQVMSIEDLITHRDHFAIVSQQTHIFNDTIYANLQFGATRSVTRQEIEEAARLAHVREFVDHFPQGFETILGDKGIRLSGGQRQRIAIARAILSNAPVFLLDEATNALDSDSERLIQETLNETLKGKTAIIIAHRLATVRNCDRIIVLSRKGIEGIGTHNELLTSSPLYQKLAKQQFIIEGKALADKGVAL